LFEGKIEDDTMMIGAIDIDDIDLKEDEINE
jgi:hypothetical protein